MNIGELFEAWDQARDREGQIKKRIAVCAGAGCVSSGALEAMEKLKALVKEKNVDSDVDIIPTGCMGACNEGPLVGIQPDGTIYQRISVDNVQEIVDKHIVNGKIASKLILFSDDKGKTCEKASEHPFFKKQHKIVLKNCGDINPESLQDYIRVGGYQALHKALVFFSPEKVIEEIKKSGLRGRGGGGYPAGLKWQMVRAAKGEPKYVICNGDEGDPGAFMDRSVLEGNPHRVIQGMTIAGYAVGASKGYLYVRAEYPLAIKRFENALKQAKKAGLLGEKIFETDFAFDIEVRIGAGAFVCGEETALIASIEGKRGAPKPRPPYPAVSGLWGKPTLINNVETFANIVPIINLGGEWFSKIGTPDSTGTKVFALAGKIKNTGLIEVPMGTTLREVIFDIGGGIPDGKKFKAAQTGGPSGGCIPTQHLDIKLDFENLRSVGSIIGSGGLIIMDETSCMVDVARYFMEFCMDESCGKCVPCRVGTKQMFDLLAKICKGEGTMSDLHLLEELSPMVKETSLCGLGQTAPNPLLSTLKYFREEYIAHIEKKKCPSGVCHMKKEPALAGRV